jgi:hypothetical protein
MTLSKLAVRDGDPRQPFELIACRALQSNYPASSTSITCAGLALIIAQHGGQGTTAFGRARAPPPDDWQLALGTFYYEDRMTGI